jgi:hypothetical protein
VPQVDRVLDRSFARDHRVRDVAVQHGDSLVETFERAYLRIVAREDARRRDQLDQELGDRRQQPVHSLRQCLDDEIVTVAVDDERRQKIRFPMHETEGRRLELQRRAVGDGCLEAGADQRFVGNRIAARQHADGDLRAIAEERVADRPLTWSDHLHDGATGRIHVDDIATIDPGMPAADPLFAAGRDDNDRHMVSWCKKERRPQR